MRTRTKLSQVELSKLAFWQKHNKIYLDDAFQSQERWTLKDKQEYLTSLLEGRAVTSIILARLKSLVDALEMAYGKDHEDTVFFQKLINIGYEYITIDGNNRDRCICDFVNGGFALSEKEYDISEPSLPIFKADMSNKYYTSLPADVKKFIDDIKLNILNVVESDRTGLAELFIAVNKGMHLNAQERRNAIMCVFGDWVRGLVKTLELGFAKIYSDKALNRRHADEMVVTAAVLIAKGVETITCPDRDAAYSDTSAAADAFNKAVVPVMTDIVQNMVEPYGVGGINIDGFESGNFIDLIMLVNYMRENKIYIKDFKAFYNWFSLTQNERIQNPDILYKGKKGTNKRTYAGLLRGTGKNFLKIRYDMLVESLGIIPENVVTFRDRVRDFDPKLRYFFWKRQEGLCPLRNKYIEPRFIWDTKITHIDHNIPWSKEGETSKENGQLTFADANLSKGDTLMDLDEVEIDQL
jgi:hypothetical protein